MLRMYVVFSDHLVIAHFNVVRLVHVTWRIGQQRPSCLQRDWSAVPPRCHQHVPNPSGMFSSMFPSAVLSLTLFLLHQAIAVLAGQSLGRYVQTSLISILLWLTKYEFQSDVFTGHASHVHRSRLTCSQVMPHVFTGHVSRVHRSRQSNWANINITGSVFSHLLANIGQWLPVKQRVEYKLCMMVHRCLYGDAPSYLADLITPSAAATVWPGLKSAASSSVAVPRTIWPVLRGCWSTCMEQTSTTASSRLLSCYF